MIGFWNRKELYMGWSMNRWNDIRNILSMYYIYVHKNDYERAYGMII